jgi:hypothetical protein
LRRPSVWLLELREGKAVSAPLSGDQFTVRQWCGGNPPAVVSLPDGQLITRRAREPPAPRVVR